MTNVYAKRRQALAALMQQKGVDYVLINNPTNMFYYCGVMYHTMERLSALLFAAASGDTHLVLPAMELGRLSDDSITEIPYLDGENNIKMLADQIKKGAKIGIEKDYLNFGRAEALAQELSAGISDFADIAPMVAGMRLIKDEAEIELMQIACTKTDEMLAIWKKCLHEGVKESEIRFELVRLMALTEGVEAAFNFQSSIGANTAIAHGIRGERIAKAGEQVIIDFGLCYQHYNSDITRTFFIGEPEKEFGEIYKIIQAANQAGIEAAKPGVKIKAVDDAARKVITDAGYGEYFTHRTGHGLGIDVHESPNIRYDNEDILVPGMTFTVEPGIYLPGRGGVRIEDDILITETGHRILTGYNRELEMNIIK